MSVSAPEFTDTPDAATMELPTIDQAPNAAPWGRRADGTPKAKPGRKRRSDQAAGERVRPPRKTPPARPTRAPRGPDYAAGVRSLLSLPAMLLALLARVTGRTDLAADAAAITLHADELATAAQTTAHQDPRFAAILDRTMSVGPYGALFAALGVLGMQVAANHRLIPAAPALGILEPDTLVTEQATAQMREAGMSDDQIREAMMPRDQAAA